MEFAIGITTYSQADNSRADCIRSLLSICQNRRVYIFDDGSDDPVLLEFLRSIHCDRIQVFFSPENNGPEFNNARAISYFYNRGIDPWLLLDDDVYFDVPAWIEILENQFDPLKPLLFYKHLNYCYGFLISGNKFLIDQIGGFDLKRFEGLKYGLCHMDFQERARRGGFAKEVKSLLYRLINIGTANPAMQDDCRKRYDHYSGVINDPKRAKIAGTLLSF